MHRLEGSALKSELINETSQPPHLLASEINVLHNRGSLACERRAASGERRAWIGERGA